MKSTRLLHSLLLCTLSVVALPACDDEESPDTDKSADAASEASSDENAEAADKPSGEDEAADDEVVSVTGVDKFKAWHPVHALLNAPVVRGSSVGASSAVVVTKDNHVGVSSDGGGSWNFIRHTHGTVIAADGYDGGPYVVVGGSGYVATSADGTDWTDRHRYTNNSLVAVATAPFGIVAISNKGEFVRYAKEGFEAVYGVFPDKFKPSAVFETAEGLVATAGKKAYQSSDGVTWTRLDSAPTVSGGKESLTSAGVCSLGKVGKKAKGVVCRVKGTAHGLADNVAAVENKGTVALTRDGGNSWATARLPFKSASAIFGSGPFYAVGSKGELATSTDGSRWNDGGWTESNSFSAGIVDGSVVIVVGGGGTIIVSKDSGKTWDYAEPPVSGSFKSVVKEGGTYVVSDGRTVLTSADGMTWTEDVDSEPFAPGKPVECDTLPAAGERCRFYAERTTPEGIPNVRAFSFNGNSGIAMGDSALVAMTADGGTTWNVKTGLNLGRVSLFATKGQTAVASNGKRVVVSNDGGANWLEGQLDGKFKFSAVHVSENGNVYAMGSGGTLLVAAGTHEVFSRAQTVAKDKTRYVRMLDAGGSVYAAGAKGELWRSADGTTFSRVVTGSSSSVQAMAAQGDHVVVVTAPGRRSGNTLLRSEDGGAHFFSVGELSDYVNLDPSGLYFEGERLHFRDRVSDDLGRSWYRVVDNYWGGAVDAGDGIRLVNRVFAYSKDKLYAITGNGDNDWVHIEDVYSEGGRVYCEPDTGCWMLAGGTIYRPV